MSLPVHGLMLFSIKLGLAEEKGLFGLEHN